MTFIISGDGKELWRSKPTGSSDSVVNFEVAVSGVQKLTLKVEGTQQEDPYSGGLPADWIMIRLIK